MMKRNRHITMRICSAFLTVCLLCNLLPVSAIAYAGNQDKAVNV